MRVVYFDCQAGAAGDMLLGALLDAGEQLEMAQHRTSFIDRWMVALQPLLALEDHARVEAKRVMRAGVECLKIDFFVGDTHADHHHAKGHGHSHGHHDHRHYRDIKQLIVEWSRQGALSVRAAKTAERAFELLAVAEGKVHGIDPEKVHFHEVGAFDAIMDIVGFGIALELLTADRIEASPVTFGSGFVEAAHGRMSVPPPAVAEIALRSGIPTTGLELQGECLTPTGAALLAATVERWGGVPALTKIEAQGFGAGTRDTKGMANAVRVLVGAP